MTETTQTVQTIAPFDWFQSVDAKALILILLIVLGGVLGAIARTVHDQKISQKEITKIWDNHLVIIGVFSALITPLILKLISSTYFENFFVQNNTKEKFYENSIVLLGIFSAASYFSENIIQSIKEKLNGILKDVEEAKANVEQAKAKSEKIVNELAEDKMKAEEDLILLELKKSNLDPNSIQMLSDIITKYKNTPYTYEDLEDDFREIEGKEKLIWLNSLIEKRFINKNGQGLYVTKEPELTLKAINNLSEDMDLVV